MEIVKKSNAFPDKDYGQNFLVEPDVCKRIVDSLNIEPEDEVLEIGPGLGSLTHFLDEQSKRLTVIDIDERMVAFLKLVYPDVNIVLNDIRKEKIDKFTKIIGNLPYNITTETIVYIMLNATITQQVVLMVQSDAFPHFFDTSGKEYGPVSVLIHLLGNSRKLFQVKPGSFYPSPKCGSTVFSIEIERKYEIEEVKSVYLFSKALFLNRRKTIYNNLSTYLGNKEKTMFLLEQCQIKQNDRPEDISPNKYLELYRLMINNK